MLSIFLLHFDYLFYLALEGIWNTYENIYLQIMDFVKPFYV